MSDRFTTTNFLLGDDFEQYDDNCSCIFVAFHRKKDPGASEKTFGETQLMWGKGL